MIPRLVVVSLLALGGTAVPATAAPLKLQTKPYRDGTNGFELRLPRRWKQVATSIQEPSAIAKWRGRAQKGRFETQVQVYRFARRVPSGNPFDGGMFRPRWTGFWPMVELLWGRTFESLKREKAFQAAPKHKVQMRIYAQPRRPGAGPRADAVRGYLVCASIRSTEEPELEFGVLFSCAVVDAPQMRAAFLESLRSFRVVGAEADLSDLRDTKDKDRGEERRALRKRKLIEGWDAVDTRHYLILFNKKVRKSLVRQVAEQVEAIRAQVYEKLFPPERELGGVWVVRICKGYREYLDHGGTPNSGGQWDMNRRELLFYPRGRDSLRILYHEAFHQYVFYATGGVTPDAWFDEGHGDYFSGFNYRNGKFEPGAFYWRTGAFARALRAGRRVPLDRFFRLRASEYRANKLCYPQGWAFVYFLREIQRRKLTRYKKYWGLLDRYYEALRTQRGRRTRAEVLRAMLDGVDLASLERAWLSFMRRAK